MPGLKEGAPKKKSEKPVVPPDMAAYYEKLLEGKGMPAKLPTETEKMYTALHKLFPDSAKQIEEMFRQREATDKIKRYAILMATAKNPFGGYANHRRFAQMLHSQHPEFSIEEWEERIRDEMDQ
jgi:hypothetical protein